MQGSVLERECALAGAFHDPGGAPALRRRRGEILRVESLCGAGRQRNALQWKCKEKQGRDGFSDGGASVRVWCKRHCHRRCVASPRSSGSARHEEAEHETVAEECVTGDAGKASKEGSISGSVLLDQPFFLDGNSSPSL